MICIWNANRVPDPVLRGQLSRSWIKNVWCLNSLMPNFTFCGRREHNTTTFFFFSWTLIQSFRIQLQKIYKHLTNWTRWNKRERVWSSVTSLFKWRFCNRRPRCCLNFLLSIPNHAPFFIIIPNSRSSKKGNPASWKTYCGSSNIGDSDYLQLLLRDIYKPNWHLARGPA